MENIKARAKRLADCFNLTIEEWETIDRFQNSLCAICQTRQKSGKRLSTDHCHDTGLIRGLLCNHCNHLLGKIENAIKRHPARPPIDTYWTGEILERLIEFITHPPAVEALGKAVLGYPGRVGTKEHRKALKRAAKAALKRA
jgi:hypothetical protein